jgi:hypothetical protein
MSDTTKSTGECSRAETLAAEAYALLRQVRFYLSQSAPTPRATDETRTAVREFCDRYEAEQFPRKGGDKA